MDFKVMIRARLAHISLAEKAAAKVVPGYVFCHRLLETIDQMIINLADRL
jgi:hypothetical protein